MTMTTQQPWPRGIRLRTRTWRGALSVRGRAALPRRLSARADQHWRRRRRHRLTVERLLAQVTRCATTVVVRQTLRGPGEFSRGRAALMPSLTPVTAGPRPPQAPHTPVPASAGTRASAATVTRHRAPAPPPAANGTAAAPRAQAGIEVRAGVSHTHTRTFAARRTHSIALRVEQRTRLLLTRHSQSFAFARHTHTGSPRGAAASSRLAATAATGPRAATVRAAAAPAAGERAFRGTPAHMPVAPRGRSQGAATREVSQNPRSAPTIWRSPSVPDRAGTPAALVPAPARLGTAAGEASPGFTPAHQAPSPARIPAAAPRLDAAALDRLAEDVMTRIERRVRIERERRGL